MRKVVYGCAMSLDGFIAGPNGEADWIVLDPEIDFVDGMRRFDTFLVGRRTWESMHQAGGAMPPMPGVQTIVCSSTLSVDDCPGATLAPVAERAVNELKARRGNDIAIFGGGALFRSLLSAKLVDEVAVSIIPVLLGGGVPFLPSPAERALLTFSSHRVYPRTGIVGIEYATRW
jgi:dihydrofolate reductase